MKTIEKTRDCAINRELIIFKIFYFFYLAGWGATNPYFTLFFKQFSFSIEEAGLLFGFFNFCRLVGAPLIGAVADKTKSHRGMLILCLFCLSAAFTFISVSSTIIEPNYILYRNSTNLTVPAGNATVIKTTGRVIGNVSSAIFVYLLIALFIAGIMDGPAHSIADTLILETLHGESWKYGYTRGFGSIGFSISSVSIGLFVAYNTSAETDYRPCLYTSAAVYFVAFITGFGIKTQNIDKKEGKIEFWKHFKSGLSIKLIIVFIVAIISGSFRALVDSFLFWHLENIGGTQTVFSIIKLVHGVVDTAGFFLSSVLIKWLGHVKVMFLSMLIFFVKYLSIALITNPWFSLPIEMLRFGVSFFLTSGISYVGYCSGVPATYQGTFTALYFGLGHTVGPVVGGLMMTKFGSRNTFLIASLVSIVTGVIFLVAMTFASGSDNKREVGYSKANIKEVSDDE